MQPSSGMAKSAVPPIIRAIDEEIAAELEKVKTAAEAKARQMGDYEKVRLQEETNRKLSHSVVETGR